LRARRLVATLALAFATLAAPLPAAAEERIAVVDVQGAVMQTEDGIRAQATLKKLFDRRQQQLDARQTELQRARADIERQARVLSREALQRRMETWQREMVDLQTVFVDYNTELQKKQAQLTEPVVKRMIAIITRVANREGFVLVIDKQAAPFVRPDLDLTERVVQMYNSGESGDPAPAASP
jgi:outer membrane protein